MNEQEKVVGQTENVEPPALLTAAGAAKMLNLSIKTIRKFARSGRLPSRRYGRAVRFALDEIMAAGR
jgi:excisionase family DNA binding protein